MKSEKKELKIDDNSKVGVRGEEMKSPPDKGGSPTVPVEDRGVGF